MSVLCQNIENEIIITGYEGPVSYLQIPETLYGRPVTRVAVSAFSRRADIVFAKLPASLTRLERFAFYGCSSLEKISLCDGIKDYGDGVFRQCRNLHEAELFLRNKGYYVLKELLADCDRTIVINLTLPDGSARLTFPEYLYEYREDTFARALHLHIEGAGYQYRECVSRKGIDFRGYDLTFEKLRLANIPLACRIAMDRLCFPYQLEKGSEEIYKDHLRVFGAEAAEIAVESRRMEWVKMLVESKLLNADALHEVIQMASEKDLPEYVAVLVSALPRSGRKGRMEL